MTLKDLVEKNTAQNKDTTNNYKKADLDLGVKTDHPAPYSRESRFSREDDYWVRNSGRKDEAVILCGGDLMCEPAMSQAAYLCGEYDFRPSFRFLRPVMEKADLTLANLETIVSARLPYAREIHKVPHHTGIRYHCNAPAEYLDALRYSLIDGLVLANNHNADGGYEGIIDTLDNLDSRDFMHTGLFRGYDDDRVLLISVNGIKLAVLSYTEHINRNLDQEILTEAGCEHMINHYSEKRVASDISAARARGAEFVIVYIHFNGKEYSHTVLDRQYATAQQIADSGADCIMGSHMHCIQKYDTVTSSDGRRVPVTYSLGNLMTSDKTGVLTKRTFLYKMVLKKEGGKVCISRESFIPCRVVESALKESYTVFPTQKKYRKKKNVLLQRAQETIKEEIGDKLLIDEEE